MRFDSKKVNTRRGFTQSEKHAVGVISLHEANDSKKTECTSHYVLVLTRVVSSVVFVSTHAHIYGSYM